MSNRAWPAGRRLLSVVAVILVWLAVALVLGLVTGLILSWGTVSIITIW